MSSKARRTTEELISIWDSYESQQLNNNNEYKNKQITFQHWFGNDWVYTTKKVQVFCQICLNDNVDKEVIDDYIFNTAIYYNDNYVG